MLASELASKLERLIPGRSAEAQATRRLAGLCFLAGGKARPILLSSRSGLTTWTIEAVARDSVALTWDGQEVGLSVLLRERLGLEPPATNNSGQAEAG